MGYIFFLVGFKMGYINVFVLNYKLLIGGIKILLRNLVNFYGFINYIYILIIKNYLVEWDVLL